MLRSMYSGISGMRGFQIKLDVIGNNVANVNTVGFKAGRVMFKDIMSQTLQGAGAPVDPFGGTNPQQIGLGSTISAIDTIMNNGAPQVTNRPLDFAIQGEGFFTVVNENDEVFYTRSGNFYFDETGNLVTADGWKVVDSAGAPIVLDDMSAVKSFSFDSKGILTVVDGEGGTTTFGPIGLAKFANPAGLEKVGGSMFRSSPNSGEAIIASPGDTATGTGVLLVGSLEMSNVDLTNEFTEMIVAQRGFQANSRTITTADEILQEIVNLKR
ncbi:flagellar basal-body rod protein FlgF [Tumebacillus algifaecis]|uniref:Flagellar basal-body rod protein FlgF n=1 Tax=Tumebacillus algifaecis TaxID=1214604 RepID=A0A223D2N7_9BACL|nr:flagellar basal body rod protein FlgG [Tumebacillus algifaecis]ASS75644.1 flagellar basal-body rod protein FlgF [Tumebacillus algifaecis]